MWYIRLQVVDKYSLALEYISTSSLSDSDVASFLASDVMNSLSRIVGLSDDVGR